MRTRDWNAGFTRRYWVATVSGMVLSHHYKMHGDGAMMLS